MHMFYAFISLSYGDDSAQRKLRLQQAGTAEGFLLSDSTHADTRHAHIGVLFPMSALFLKEPV
ncbi:Hypothetical protein HEAR1059 [Herminiimonas arsenicoxydans]|uniref:Uncharacterized protein n=1 Tax=Herminiimonas arsenicoxydans TaxID=204773 RepID=A4G401_HERAR|nr:Hypothetical protein HEAR1059 [Herminiimonas arsenicoxydans]